MKTKAVLALFTSVLAFASSAFSLEPPPPWLIESTTPQPSMRLVWQTEPGVRYDLWTSTNLTNWTQAPGFPSIADGLSREYVYTPGPRNFFRFAPIDEQPPVVEAQFPEDNGFAVGRFADLSIQLKDASGINPATIQFTVSGLGTFGPTSPGFAFANNTITFDSGDAALGAYGATVTATLIVADTKGNTLNYSWSFNLEPSPQVASNIYVFGSPTAQRAGQRVSGPAAALASRFATGPIKMSGSSDPWTISSVTTDRIVIAYTAGNPPAFTAGQLVCNLVPTKENEIFYRRILSVSNDPATSQLTLMTEEATLSDFVTQGSVSFSSDSVIYELDGAGTLVKAISINRDLSFPRSGIDLSGSRFKLGSGGDFEATVLGTTFKHGSSPAYLDITATELSWWFTPQVHLALEWGLGKSFEFECIPSGDISLKQAFQADVTAVGLSTKTTIWQLAGPLQPRFAVIVGVIGVPPVAIPVYAELGFDFRIETEAKAEAVLDLTFAYRQDIRAKFGLTYDQASGFGWPHDFQASSPDLSGNVDLAGKFSLEFTLVPRLNILVYSCAGISVNLEPHAGVEVKEGTGGFDGELKAGIDFTIAPAGPLLEPLLPGAWELNLPIWEGEWSLAPATLSFITQPESRTVAPGTDISFTCTVTSSKPASFQWFHNSLPIPGQTGRSLFLPRVNTGHVGSYFVRASADGLSADSNAATLTVQVSPPVGNIFPAPKGMVLIPAGSFQMGDSLDGDGGALAVHTVNVSAFYMDKYEVTKALWDEVRAWGLNNGYTDLDVGAGKATNHPVQSITWYAMVKWCNARSRKEGLTECYTVGGAVYKTGQSTPVLNMSANGYRLPTEAEWEKAARGGLSGKRFPWGDTISRSQANYHGGRDVFGTVHSYDLGPEGYNPTYATGNYPYTSPVGSFAANGYGLYDMAGNVLEWCWDWGSTYGSGNVSDPTGPASGSYRVLRGGCWSNDAGRCSAAARGYDDPARSVYYFGFRCARSSVP